MNYHCLLYNALLYINELALPKIEGYIDIKILAISMSW